jgi:hypothetical protein
VVCLVVFKLDLLHEVFGPPSSQISLMPHTPGHSHHERKHPRKKALLIGIRDVAGDPELLPLDGPHDDVENMKDLLICMWFSSVETALMPISWLQLCMDSRRTTSWSWLIMMEEWTRSTNPSGRTS